MAPGALAEIGLPRDHTVLVRRNRIALVEFSECGVELLNPFIIAVGHTDQRYIADPGTIDRVQVRAVCAPRGDCEAALARLRSIDLDRGHPIRYCAVVGLGRAAVVVPAAPPRNGPPNSILPIRGRVLATEVYLARRTTR